MHYSCSNKKSVQILLEQCYKFGLKHVVISPGSRNAPLIIAFGNHPEFICYSIPDERSAAFYALGMAKQLKEPVGLVCTSGTAVLNYAPALTEAYYQEVPVIAITADRPPYMIDQEDGQTIRQHNIFANHINYSCTLSINEEAEDLDSNTSEIEAAFHRALNYPQGSVHINIPFEEPLYNQEEIEFDLQEHNNLNQNPTIEIQDLNEIVHLVNRAQKVLILSGVQTPNSRLNEIVNHIATKYSIPVLAPPTSNLFGENILNSVDLLFYSIKKDQIEDFTPDILITIGGPVVSKVAKQFLRANKPAYHIDIDVNSRKIDTYGALTHQITAKPNHVFDKLEKLLTEKTESYLNIWQQQNTSLKNKEAAFYQDLDFCDLKIFKIFFDQIDEPIDLHLGNSTPVRYGEFFDKHQKINYFCNRGTSGIDGSTSTAAGAALVSGNETVLITGDISFLYDSNAFWNRHVPKNLKVILINNKGGNIFKVINGPAKTQQLDDFFVSNQSASAKKICEAYDINYLSAKNENSFMTELESLLTNTKCSVLEVFTESDLSAKNYKALIIAVRT